jgi:hypothetical protein
MGEQLYYVPLFSEYPGQHLNAELDLEHYWSAVAMFFPEDLPVDALRALQASVLPLEGPLEQDVAFRTPRLKEEEEGEEDDSEEEDEEEGSECSYEGEDEAPGEGVLLKAL